MTRGARLPALAPGIYPDAYGFEVRVRVKGRAFGKRFPPDHPLELMQAWQAEERAYRLRSAVDAAAATPGTARGTLAGDVTHYLQKRVGRPGYKSDRSHLAAWTKAHGSRPRHQLSKHLCERAIGAWLKAKKSPKTIRHRVRVLKELWHALDGKRLPTPVDDLKLPAIVKVLPAPVPDETIIAVADSLLKGKRSPKGYGGDSQITYARFLIRALTGQRPCQVGRAKPEDIDRTNRIWWVRAAKGGKPIPFPLTDELELAFLYFDTVKAWGEFDTRSFSKTLKRHGWPQRIKPYALRHSFAIAQLLAGTDLGDLQGLLGHANPQTTRIYAPVLVSRLKSAVERRGLSFDRK